MNVVDKLHERIAAVLKWSVQDCRGFSLAALREFVRERDEQLWHDIGDAIRFGEHIVGKPLKKRP